MPCKLKRALGAGRTHRGARFSRPEIERRPGVTLVRLRVLRDGEEHEFVLVNPPSFHVSGETPRQDRQRILDTLYDHCRRPAQARGDR